MQDARHLAAEADAAKAVQLQVENLQNFLQSKRKTKKKPKNVQDNNNGITHQMVIESPTMATIDSSSERYSLNPSGTPAQMNTGTINQINSECSQANELLYALSGNAPLTPTPVNIQTQSNDNSSGAPLKTASMNQQITAIIRPSVAGPPSNISPIYPPPQLQHARKMPCILLLSKQRPPSLLVLQQPSSKNSSLVVSQKATVEETLSTAKNLKKQQALQQKPAESLDTSQHEVQKSAANRQTMIVVQSQLPAGGQQELRVGFKALPQQSRSRVLIL